MSDKQTPCPWAKRGDFWHSSCGIASANEAAFLVVLEGRRCSCGRRVVREDDQTGGPMDRTQMIERIMAARSEPVVLTEPLVDGYRAACGMQGIRPANLYIDAVVAAGRWEEVLTWEGKGVWYALARALALVSDADLALVLARLSDARLALVLALVPDARLARVLARVPDARLARVLARVPDADLARVAKALGVEVAR